MHGAVLLTVLDVTVETQDYTHLTLKVRTANQLSPSRMNYAVFKTYTGLHMLVFCTFAAASTYKSFCGYEPPVVAICNYYAHVLQQQEHVLTCTRACPACD